MTVIFSTSDTSAVEAPPSFTKDTNCPYCGVGCGVKATVQDNQLIAVEGRADHPANQGRLCVKGSSLHETTSMQYRLLNPRVNGQDTDWDTALDYVADKFKSIVAEHGPDAVAFYLSGQILTEDYYVANKLMKGFIGTANVDTNSRLCMASAVVAHKRAFGADAVPASYEDLELTDLIFFVGSNPAYAHPILFQRVVKAQKERGTKVVVVDPRRTATCDIADLHLAIKPGSDAFFFNGLLSYLAANNKLDNDYISQHTDGFEAALQAAQAQVPTLEKAAELCDVALADIQMAYQLFAENERVISMFSMGINQSSSGVDKANAIINCHLATGKIGKEGAAPFSITGQPNAMGGREVGGLANQLAAHMNFTESDLALVEDFWQAPRMARQQGLKAVDLFDAIDEGKVKAVWVMGTNPVVSMPNADKVKRALDKCDLVVVSDCNDNTDTGMLADVLLPATTWGEKHGTVTNSDRTVSIQRSFLTAPGQARNDWDIICDFARRLGYVDAFDYQNGAEIFAEHAKLSGVRNDQSFHRAFDISAYSDISVAEYENFQPIQWPVNNQAPTGTKRLFTDGQFYTENGRAKFIPIEARLPQSTAKSDEFVLNTGRIRDQWHTMTRTGKAPRLLTHEAEPFIQINPKDAESLDIADYDIVQCTAQGSQYLGRAKLTTDQRQGELFAPMHWNKIHAANSRAGALIKPEVDPFCGQPEFKHSTVKVAKYRQNYHGFIATTEHSFKLSTEYWAKVTIDAGNAFTFADQNEQQDWRQWLGSQFSEVTDWVELTDPINQGYRALGFVDNKLIVAFVVSAKASPTPVFNWLSSQLGQVFATDERFALLAATPGDDSASPGAMVCSCFQVGENQIKAAVEAGLHCTESLGNALKCGTNCGSCIPELNSLIAKFKV